MPAFSEEGWVAICHRKLVVNLSLFLAHSGSFFRSMSHQKSKDNSTAMYQLHSRDSFSFLIFFPFFIHAPKCFFPCNGVCQSLRNGAFSYSFISHFSFTFLGLNFVSILFLSPLNGTSAKDNYAFHAIQHIPVLLSSPFFICIG